MRFQKKLWALIFFLFPIKQLLISFSLLLISPTLIFFKQPAAIALMADKINQISTEFTVLIDAINPASGVIISRKKDTYYVLTANHVVETQDEYAIFTKDGERYEVDYQKIIKLPGVDLAVVEFQSSKNYQVATLA
ncbi:MAG: serine protease, partial [Trichodesmium sp. St11_bin5]|nr:serine protease [Trichodesmium sp. St11_bin5]